MISACPGSPYARHFPDSVFATHPDTFSGRILATPVTPFCDNHYHQSYTSCSDQRRPGFQSSRKETYGHGAHSNIGGGRSATWPRKRRNCSPDATACDSGATALACERVRRPAPVLLDLAMPRMDGFEFASDLPRPELAHAPVSTRDQRVRSSCSARAREAGIGHDLLKPAAPARLKALLVALTQLSRGCLNLSALHSCSREGFTAAITRLSRTGLSVLVQFPADRLRTARPERWPAGLRSTRWGTHCRVSRSARDVNVAVRVCRPGILSTQREADKLISLQLSY